MKDLLSCHGKSFTAKICGTSVEGKITVENGRTYLCQNERNGVSCKDKQGFKFSWEVGKGTKENLFSYSVNDFKLKQTNPQTFGATGSEFILKGAIEELVKLGYEIATNDDFARNGSMQGIKYISTSNIYFDPAGCKYFKKVGLYCNITVDKQYFELPRQFNEFLEFAKEQMDVLNEFIGSKEEKKEEKKEIKPKFKVGDYIKNSRHIGKITNIENNIYTYWGYCIIDTFTENGVYEFHSNDEIPTEDEIKFFLLRVAKEKGFKTNVHFHPVNSANKKVSESKSIIKNEMREATYHYDEDILCIDGNIYCNGVWGEIVKDKKVTISNGRVVTVSPTDITIEGHNISINDFDNTKKWVINSPSINGYKGIVDAFHFGCVNITYDDLILITNALSTL